MMLIQVIVLDLVFSEPRLRKLDKLESLNDEVSINFYVGKKDAVELSEHVYLLRKI